MSLGSSGKRRRLCVAIFAVITIVSALVLTASVCLADVSWGSDGRPLCRQTSDQDFPRTVSDGSGGAITAWRDQRAGNWDIFAQKVDSNGNTLWALDGIAICNPPAGDVNQFDITSDGADGAILFWNDNRSGNLDIYAQRVDSNGNVGPAIPTVPNNWVANGTVICNAPNDQFLWGWMHNRQIIEDGSGGAIMSWDDRRTDPNGDIYAQRVDGNGRVGNAIPGAPNWIANGVAITIMPGGQIIPEVATDGSGGSIISFNDITGLVWDPYAQRVDSTGRVGNAIPGAPNWIPNGTPMCTGVVSSRSQAHITHDGVGGAIVVWDDDRAGVPNVDIYAQRVDGTGRVGPAMPIAPNNWLAGGVNICNDPNRQVWNRVTTDGSGGAISVWLDERVNPGNPYDLFSNRIDGSGTLQWGATGVSITSAGHAFNQEIIYDGSGGAVVTWQDNRTGNFDIYAQRADSLGVVQWTANGLPICTNPAGDQLWPTLTTDDEGGAIFAWQDERVVNWDIYAQRALKYMAPLVIGIDPDLGHRKQVLRNVSISGKYFRNTPTTVQLRRGAETINGTNVTFISASQLTADFDLSGATEATDWDVYVKHDDDGQSGILTGGFEVLPKLPGSNSWFIAEGSTGGGFDTWVLLQNPGDEQADVDVTFSTDAGPQDTVSFTMDPETRTTVRVADYVPDTWGVSTIIESDRPIVAERSMYWDKDLIGETSTPGDPQPFEMRSGHANLGVPVELIDGAAGGSREMARTRFFPEGATAGGFDTWILLMNPNDTNANAKVTLMTDAGAAITEEVTVEALSRETVHLDEYLPDAYEVATEVVSDVPLVAERSMYWDPDEVNIEAYQMRGGHSNAGSPAPSKDWILAEGSTGGGFETYILIQNPADSEATFTADFYDETGFANTTTRTMPARSRATLKVSDYVPDNFHVGTGIESDTPIVAERSMYWDRRLSPNAYDMRDGHSTVGVNMTGSTWMVPEGSTGAGFDSFVLIANTSDTDSDVSLTFMTQDGPTNPVLITIPADSRYTVRLSDYVPDEFQVSTFIGSTAELVVERAMYWDRREPSPTGEPEIRPYEMMGGHSAGGVDP